MQGSLFFEFFNCIFPSWLGYTYIFILTDEWRCKKSVVTKTLILFSVLFLGISWLLLYRLGISQKTKGYISMIGLLAGIILYLRLSRYRDGRALFIYFSAASFNMISAAMGEVIGSAFAVARIFVKLTIHVIIFILVYRYFSRPFKRLMDEMKRGWQRMALVPFSFSLLCISLLLTEKIYHDPGFKLIALSLALAIVCNYSVLYHFFCIMQEQYRTKSNYALIATQLNSLQKQMETEKAANEQLSIFRHDIRHFIAIQYDCLKSGNIEGAEKVLTSMEKTLNEITRQTPKYTESPLINGVIANYAEKAEKSGIQFSAILARPERKELECVEMAVVISNALENAWKACMKIPKEKERFIKLNGVRCNGQYLMEITNTFEEKVRFNKEHTAPVSEEDGHGYGTQSILAFAEKYHACVDFKLEGNVFKLRMIF